MRGLRLALIALLLAQAATLAARRSDRASSPRPCSLARSPAAKAGAFLDWGDRPTFVDGQLIRLGPEQVPVVDYGEGNASANPYTVAEWGLQEFSYSLDGDASGSHLDAARRAADWLLDRQERDGSWTYDFDYTTSDGQTLRAPWISGIAQGAAISLLVRVAGTSGDSRYLAAAREATRPLRVALEEGGLRSRLPDGGLFVEEYPTTKRPQHVLNGFIVTLIGLHDLASTGDNLAASLYEDGRASLDANLWRWDNDGRVAYNLSDRHVNPSYDRQHSVLLQEMLVQRPSPALRHWLDRWYPPCPA